MGNSNGIYSLFHSCIIRCNYFLINPLSEARDFIPETARVEKIKRVEVEREREIFSRKTTFHPFLFWIRITLTSTAVLLSYQVSGTLPRLKANLHRSRDICTWINCKYFYQVSCSEERDSLEEEINCSIECVFDRIIKPQFGLSPPGWQIFWWVLAAARITCRISHVEKKYQKEMKSYRKRIFFQCSEEKWQFHPISRISMKYSKPWFAVWRSFLISNK